MAARRAGRTATAEPTPPPPETVPEPEPEPKEPEKEPEKPSLTDDAARIAENLSNKNGKVTERIIERIIICPGGQNPYMPPPPVPQGHCHCTPIVVSAPKKRKGKKKGGDEADEPCKHPFCIVQRARNRPQGLPWASGLYTGAPPQPQAEAPPPIVVCQRPVLCCCPKCRPAEDSSSDSEEEDPTRMDTQQYMTFMNMVFAAANVMNERPDVF